jgi:hypothetical protein
MSYENEQPGTFFSWIRSWKSYTVFKYVITVEILVFLTLLMVYTSGSTRAFEEVSSAVEQALPLSRLQKASAQGLKRYYGLNQAEYEGVMLYTAESALSAEEFLLIQVKDEGQMEQVKQAVEERIASRLNDFEGYVPEEAQRMKEAKISVRGKYLFFVVSSDADLIMDLFTMSL